MPTIHWTLGSAESGRVWLKIEDNGPGVSPEISKKLFTPFMTTKAQGTGLGLSFSKKVLEEHGGSIQYIAREQGACFEVILPGAPAQLVSHREEETAVHV
jgi:signal transduction histidine kinase